MAFLVGATPSAAAVSVFTVRIERLLLVALLSKTLHLEALCPANLAKPDLSLHARRGPVLCGYVAASRLRAMRRCVTQMAISSDEVNWRIGSSQAIGHITL